MEKDNTEKWTILNGFKIYDGGLWKQMVIGDPLSELIEVSTLKILGKHSTLDGEIIIHLCEEAPIEILEMVNGDIHDDKHVYIGVFVGDLDQKAILWTY